MQRGRTRGETVRHREAAADPDGNDVQLGRTTGETARHREAVGHGLLSLMAARESIGHVLFHQVPPHDNPPLPTRPVSELSTPNSYAEACADEYSAVLRAGDGQGVPWTGERVDFWGDSATRRAERHLGEMGVRLEAQRAWLCGSSIGETGGTRF